MKKVPFIAIVATAASFGGSSAFAEDCSKLAVSVRHAVEAKQDMVLEIVEKQVAAHEGCACEVVKAAIEGTKADASLVASIVETAVSVAPEHMRLISQCAVAVAPDSLSEVQAVLIRLDPGKGEVTYTDAKSAKNPKAPIDVKPAWNPLDFPGEGIGPNPGGPGGFPEFPWVPPVRPFDPDAGPGPATPTDFNPPPIFMNNSVLR
ncbi:hypothetical protein HAHE_27950 [Haloferula helveola]|uniref:Uncharacterized protein n=1 Tax=Haloferula helveola TaxID=490095 RepID=A0ABM7RHR7_9BACT|nr:hypothetical protein HAHE_27950 [Haloferula helveola]